MNHIISTGLLPVTPTPKENESWLGWFLRATEINGYDRPTRILTYAGLSSEHFIKCDPPLNELSEVFGFDLHKYFSPTLNSKKFPIDKDVHISSIYCNISKPKICIKCIQENKIADRLWDIKYVTACTIHDTELTTQCKHCEKSLSWNRRGLLICQCGKNIEDNPKQVSKEITSIINLIKWKVFGDETAFNRVVSDRYPVIELQNLDVNEFLGIFQRIYNRPNLHIKNSKFADAMPKTLEACFYILSDWPNSFWDYLEFHAVEPEAYINFTTQFKTFYRTFCISGQRCIPINFLHDSLIAFGDQRWQKSTIAKKSTKRAGLQRTTFGINTLAVRLGVTVPTALRYFDSGIIKGQEIRDGNNIRYIFHEHEIPFLPSEGETLTQRQAAQYLKLPQRLFAMLVKKNVFQRKRLAFGMTSFCKLDLDEFKKNLTQGNTNVDNKKMSPDWIPLQTLIRKKTISLEEISLLLKLAIGRELEYLNAKEIPDIRFDRKTLISVFEFEWLGWREKSVSGNLELF